MRNLSRPVLVFVLGCTVGCSPGDNPSNATDTAGNPSKTKSEGDSARRSAALAPDRRGEIPLSQLVAKLHEKGAGPTRDQTYSFEEVKKRMSSLKKGMTKEEVLSVLGVPKMPMSDDSWVYTQDSGSFLDGSKEGEALAVRFKDNRLLEFRLEQGVTFGVGGGGLGGR